MCRYMGRNIAGEIRVAGGVVLLLSILGVGIAVVVIGGIVVYVITRIWGILH